VAGIAPIHEGIGGERVTGIEPALSAWEADVLPLNYTRAVTVHILVRIGVRNPLNRQYAAFAVLPVWGIPSGPPQRLSRASIAAPHAAMSGLIPGRQMS
jgi:hypothetical protein